MYLKCRIILKSIKKANQPFYRAKRVGFWTCFALIGRFLIRLSVYHSMEKEDFMYHLDKKNMQKIIPLFDGWNETLLWSCLQGYMGNAWTDDIQNPQSAQIITGDFCFFAGIANLELVKNIPISFPAPCILMVPQNEEWAKQIEKAYKANCEKFMRFAIKKEPEIFDSAKLASYVEKLPPAYSIRAIDEERYRKIGQENWSRDLCSQFPTYQDYQQFGIGFVVLYQGEIVCGASSYTVYEQGIEIEIDTKEEHRRKGLALACAAKLVLTCMDRGLYPSWDAANRASVALAEKLGYHFDKEYITYAVTNFK
jgi:GNAT superfamily N-acetyltransferase